MCRNIMHLFLFFYNIYNFSIASVLQCIASMCWNVLSVLHLLCLNFISSERFPLATGSATHTHTHTHTDSSLHSLLPSHPSGLDSTHLAWAREFQQSVLFILLSFILTDILWLRALCLPLSLSSEHQGVRKGGMQGRNLLPKYVNN